MLQTRNDEKTNRLLKLVYGAHRDVDKRVLPRAHKAIDMLKFHGTIDENLLSHKLGIPIFQDSDKNVRNENNRSALQVTMRPLMAIGLVTRRRALDASTPAQYTLSFEKFENEISEVIKTAKMMCSHAKEMKTWRP